MDERNIGGILDLAYGAAADAALWPKFLELFADLTGSDSSALIWQDQRTRRGEGMAARLDPAALPAYFGAFAASHPSQRWRHDPQARVRHFIPHIVADDDALPKAELMRTDFYNDFMRPFGLHSVLRLGLSAHGETAAFLMVARPQSKDRFEGDAIDFAARLHPHVIRAFELGQKLTETRPRHDAGEAVLAGSPHALFVLDLTGRILHANPAALSLMQARDVVSAAGGHLVAAGREPGLCLQRLIAAAASTDPAERRGGSMTLTSPARRLPMPVTVAPLGAETSLAIQQRPSVLVCVSDPEAASRMSPDHLRDAFGMTPAEARVAALISDGLTLREVAGQLGLSVYTVRGQLARIFEKTGANRQSDLTRLMAAASRPWV